MTNGFLIVFEGPDEVGKSTIAHKLTAHLNSIGIATEYMAFPGRQEGTLGNHIYQLHHDSSRFGIYSMSATSLQSLHIAAHIDAVEQFILPAVQSGKTIVLDRYWWSTVAYGDIKGVSKQSQNAMVNLELLSWNGLLPTVVFLLTRSQPLCNVDDINEWYQIAANYRTIATKEGQGYPVHQIDNNRSVEDALTLIVNSLNGILSEPVLGSAQKKQNRISAIFPLEPTEIYDTYWKFAAERQEIFFRRFQKKAAPWTNDPILQQYKFTNAYRASDRVSQYLIRHVIYAGDPAPEEVFFRIILFKIFNRIQTWELLKTELIDITYAAYDFDSYDKILTKAMSEGIPIFSGAYIMPSGPRGLVNTKKHRIYLRLLETMMRDELPKRLTDFRQMSEGFELLRSYPYIGDFLALQYIVDVNYSPITNFDEMHFVVPGPGAKSGIRKCFQNSAGLSDAQIIHRIADIQDTEFERLGLNFKNLWGRPLQLIDCQNLFCEVDKYSRVAYPHITTRSNRTRIKQSYHSNSDIMTYWYPPKWGINTRLQETMENE